MGISQLQGSPWHVEQMHRKEGDDRRHKSYCKFYNPVTKQCKDCRKCKGSRYCLDYVRLSDAEFRQRQEDAAEAKRLLAKGYSTSEVATLQEQKQKAKKEQHKQATSPKKNKANTKAVINKLPNLQGKYINHKGYGRGLVVEQSGDVVSVDYSGVTKAQQLSTLIKNNLIEY